MENDNLLEGFCLLALIITRTCDCLKTLPNSEVESRGNNNPKPYMYFLHYFSLSKKHHLSPNLKYSCRRISPVSVKFKRLRVFGIQSHITLEKERDQIFTHREVSFDVFYISIFVFFIHFFPNNQKMYFEKSYTLSTLPRPHLVGLHWVCCCIHSPMNFFCVEMAHTSAPTAASSNFHKFIKWQV